MSRICIERKIVFRGFFRGRKEFGKFKMVFFRFNFFCIFFNGYVFIEIYFGDIRIISIDFRKYVVGKGNISIFEIFLNVR